MINSKQDDAIIARLEKPNAGVPLAQKLLFRYIIKPFVIPKSGWDENRKLFDDINRKIMREVKGLDENQLTKRVLIKPLVALEDSSRYWSVIMTLEHMVVVGNSIKGVIAALSNGQQIDRKVDMSLVKPKGEGTVLDTLASFEKFTQTAMDDVDAKVGDRDSKLTLFHPWFGPFNTRQWQWLLPQHQAVHLKQIREIIKGVKPSA